MSKHLLLGLASLLVLTPPTFAQVPRIDHQPAACASAEKFPRLEAGFAPTEQVATARVVFQGQTTDWYSVSMKLEGAVFVGVLPKPKKDLKSFRYYIEVTDKALGTNRTAEFITNVVDSASACKGKLMAGALGTASVILQGPAGVVALPAGFASTGVVAAGSATGSGAAVGTAAAGAGGGIGTTALVLGGVAVAGGVAAVAVSKSGGDNSSDGGSGGSGVSYTVTFDSNNNQTGIGLVECGGVGGLFFSSQGVTLDANGRFDTLWGNPVLIHAVGQASATTFQGTMTCTNGARSGTLSATGSSASYSGSFEFGNSRGTVVVTRR